MAGLDFSSRAQSPASGGGALDFSARAKPVDAWLDAGKSFLSGVGKTMSQMAAQNAPGPPMLSMLKQAVDTASFVDDLIHGKLDMPKVVQLGAPEAAVTEKVIGSQHTPQTRAGKAAQTAGMMAPAALAPGNATQRLVNVLAPTAGAEGAAEVVKALGGDEKAQDIARMAGGATAGLATGVRIKPKSITASAEDAPALETIAKAMDASAPTSAPELPAGAPEGATAAGMTPPAAQPARALAKPQESALEYVNRVAGPKPLEAVSGAPDVALGAEALGQPGKAALAALARRPGATGDALNAEVATRQLGRPSRLLDAFAQASGVSPEAAAGDIQTLVKSGRAAAAPLYEEAYAAGPMDSPALRELMARPSVKKALRNAVSIAAEEGRNPSDIGFEVSPASGDIPEMVAVKNPTAQTWDYVKRGLDDVINGYRDGTTGKLRLDDAGRATLGTLKELRSALVDANPAYGKALAASGDYLSADEAFRSASKDIFNAGLTERQFADKFDALSSSSKAAYKGGIANQFYNLAQTGRLDPKVLKTPRVQAKLRTALGPAEADRLIAMGSQEGDMLAFERRYAPNAGSITQEMKAAMDDQDSVSRGAQMAGDFASGLVKGHGVGGAATGAVTRQIQALMDSLGPTRGMSTETRDAAGQLLMLPPSELAKVLEAYRSLPRQPGISYSFPLPVTDWSSGSRPARAR